MQLTRTDNSRQTTYMMLSPADVRSLDDLRQFIHHKLCAKENLMVGQFRMSEMSLQRRGRQCGLQFLLHGPRSVRLGAIWASDGNVIYFYDAAGERYEKLHLQQRLTEDASAA